MLTPVEVLEFRNPSTGQVELLRPGRDCVSPQWFGYRRHPELFKPVHRDDTRTVARHREALERTRRNIERQPGRRGTTRAATRPNRKFSLGPDRPRDRWRLP